ncbi:hypothetical protein Peur_002922 [Populus x canadensis]
MVTICVILRSYLFLPFYIFFIFFVQRAKFLESDSEMEDAHAVAAPHMVKQRLQIMWTLILSASLMWMENFFSLMGENLGQYRILHPHQAA